MSKHTNFQTFLHSLRESLQVWRHRASAVADLLKFECILREFKYVQGRILFERDLSPIYRLSMFITLKEMWIFFSFAEMKTLNLIFLTIVFIHDSTKLNVSKRSLEQRG